MELGGKCPMVWDKTVSFEHAAYKAVFGRFVNAGQICIGVDHIFVHESQIDQAIQCILKHIKQNFGIEANNRKSQTFKDSVGALINKNSLDRLRNMIETCDGEIVLGGVDTIDE